MITVPQALLVGLIYYAANTSFLGGLAYFTTWRPLVNGFLVGLVLGDPARGALAGGLVNVLYLGYLSVGGTLGIGDAALAGITGAVAAIALPLDPAQATGVGVIVGLLLGNLGFPLLSLRMKLDGRIVRRMDRAAERGDARAVMLWNVLPAQALLFGLTVPTATVLAISISLLCASAAALPPWLLRGLAVSGDYLASALGIALAMRWVFKKWGVALFLAGVIVAAIPGIAAMFAALSGIGLAAIAVSAIAAIPIMSKRMRPRPAPGERVPRSAFWLWQFFSHSAYSFERLQGSGFACALAPAIGRWHAGAGDRAAALARHLAFFNTEVNLGSMIVSIAAGMERERASGRLDAVEADIGRVKSQLMGTLAGAGDPIVQGAILPAILSLGLVALFGGGSLHRSSHSSAAVRRGHRRRDVRTIVPVLPRGACLRPGRRRQTAGEPPLPESCRSGRTGGRVRAGHASHAGHGR